jgi:hypothetical protein
LRTRPPSNPYLFPSVPGDRTDKMGLMNRLVTTSSKLPDCAATCDAKLRMKKQKKTIRKPEFTWSPLDAEVSPCRPPGWVSSKPHARKDDDRSVGTYFEKVRRIPRIRLPRGLGHRGHA